MQVKQTVVRRSGVNFEVAGVNDDSKRRVDSQRHAIHQAVRHLNGIDGKRSDGETFAAFNNVQFGVFKQRVLFQPVFHVGQCELGAINRHVQFGEDPRQSSNVFLMAVGQDDRPDLVAVFYEVGDVGDNNIHAQQFGFREHQAGVNDDDVIFPAHGHAVHPELAQAAHSHDM